jgi:hypothetical protein
MNESFLNLPVSSVPQHSSCVMFSVLFAGTGIFLRHFSRSILFSSSGTGCIIVCTLLQSLAHAYLHILLTTSMSAVVFMVMPMVTMVMSMVLTRI